MVWWSDDEGDLVYSAFVGISIMLNEPGTEKQKQNFLNINLAYLFCWEKKKMATQKKNETTMLTEL